MKKRFPILSNGARDVRQSAFSSPKSRLRIICVVILFCLGAAIASLAQTFTTVVSFNGANGANPDNVSLVQGIDGSLYGTTTDGGANDEGTVFKITPSGTLTTIYSFCAQTDCPDGNFPAAGLVQGADGNFYGTTEGGGFSAGTVFKITPSGTLTTLHSFCSESGCSDGHFPVAALVQATDGNFYGTTSAGGNGGCNGDGCGTVFKITPTGTLTTLYSFCSQSDCADGANPYARLAQASDGNFYGTTYQGGLGASMQCQGCGTVFAMTPEGLLTTLYSFCSQSGCSDGANPYAGLAQATDGNLYGTTEDGANGGGTVFKITLAGVLTTLYTFCSQSGCADGIGSLGGLVQATDGNFYGTTADGGATGYGTIFKMSLAGTLSTLYNFCTQGGCPDGSLPLGGLFQATNGNFYGTTDEGGTNNDGTVFSLPADSYTLTVSVNGSGTVIGTGSFNCQSNCSQVYPVNTPVTLSATPAPGWTFVGWTGACNGAGPCNVTMTQNRSVTATFSQQSDLLTVSTSGSGTVSSGADGFINCPGTCGYSYPANSPVSLSATANPGWTFVGWSGACSGTGSCNVVMTQNLSVTATFTEDQGFSTLTVSINGSGTVSSTDGFIACPGRCSHTYNGGANVRLMAVENPGATFSGWSGACSGTGNCNVTMTQDLAVTATFSGTQQEIVTHSFGGGEDGQNPFASLIADSAGNLYGTTSAGGAFGKGTVFEQSAEGTETVLHSFGNPTGNDGQSPFGNLVFDANDNLYGTTSAGGLYGKGTVFEVSPNGTETVLYSFTGGGDGQTPDAGLIFVGGNLYGTTYSGGTFGYGTAFELSPNGVGGWTEAVVYSFGNGSDGKNPYAGLVSDGQGNFYGTTVYGGDNNNGGTAFELSPTNTPGIGCCRESPVYSFGNGTDGANPYATLAFDNAGNLYGTTYNGGTLSFGTAFELMPNGSGGWTEAARYDFASGNDGANPRAGLVFDGSSTLYGTTQKGGPANAGTVFELSSGIGCCREAPLYSFANGSDGANPSAGLVLASGHLYGTTVNGGANHVGTVFAIVPGPTPVQFVTLPPCRVVDTRNPDGTFGGPAISGGTARSFPLEQSSNPCNIPSNAVAYSLNVTVVPPHTLGYLTIWPTDENRPGVSTLNSLDGRIKANAAIVPAGIPSGSVSVYVTDTTDVILDIDGYFAAPSTQTLQFYALTPCRVADTRKSDFPQGLGTPHLSAGIARDFPVLASSCIPSGLNAAAYSLNVTAVPYPSLGDTLAYLEVWPTDEQPQHPVSTLNNLTGTYVANAAIVPAGTGGEITALGSNDTDLVIDINGYFAAPGQGGYSFYSVTPCRAFDSRANNGQPFTGQKAVNVVSSPCAPPSTAGGYVFNATVVPSGSVGYLTLWADSETQPVVSTLNAVDGWITSNMAIVPTSNGTVDAFASGTTQLILDISGYFAP